MPFLDVTDVLKDPDFATTFSVARSATTVGNDGETALTPSTFTGIVGVVTPANSNDLKRMAEVERLTGAIAIHTTFTLMAGGAQTDGTTVTADVVTWNGRQYSIFAVDDWTQFGAGFVRATATMLSLT
ncbi:hypothetical protein [Beijerinckia sp. L45]|uniref:hypothetical protein n=1 Tax=Beijerinckia sp. L45 TaxID=1641855 RepID=UPI00131AE33C|nr:hypothetical protein [Beijerinckia sp. L45]